MNILISGYYGSKNGGDEAMLAAMLEVLREMDGDISATVISLNPEYGRIMLKDFENVSCIGKVLGRLRKR